VDLLDHGLEGVEGARLGDLHLHREHGDEVLADDAV
jgi:hypothetical protein